MVDLKVEETWTVEWMDGDALIPANCVHVSRPGMFVAYHGDGWDRDVEVLPAPVREAAEAMWQRMQEPADALEIMSAAGSKSLHISHVIRARAAIKAERERHREGVWNLETNLAGAEDNLATARKEHREEVARLAGENERLRDALRQAIRERDQLRERVRELEKQLDAAKLKPGCV